MKVALVYDHLNKVGGAEAVLQAFHEIFPGADWYTAVYNPAKTPFSKGWKVHSSFLSRIPILRDHHEWYPYLMPFIFESYNFSDYNLVISIGSAECKGIITNPHTYHLHYCLTPTRYLYSHADEYLSTFVHRFVGKYLRLWDQVAAARPDKMIAISDHVKKRIKKYYGRDARVIYPPVNTKAYNSGISYSRQDYYLTVSRLVPYKKIDLLVNAFNQSGEKLVVVGTGSELIKLKRLARSNITFTGFVSHAQLLSYYSRARAFLQVNEEDFGISMVEAQAADLPVIAYNRGGAAEIVKDGLTGILFSDQSTKGIIRAVDKFEKMQFAQRACMKNAARFDKVIWLRKIQKEIDLCQKI